MRLTQLRQADLNLLVVFAVFAEERNVSRAAERLHLRRIRLGDFGGKLKPRGRGRSGGSVIAADSEGNSERDEPVTSQGTTTSRARVTKSS